MCNHVWFVSHNSPPPTSPYLQGTAPYLVPPTSPYLQGHWEDQLPVICAEILEGALPPFDGLMFDSYVAGKQ